MKRNKGFTLVEVIIVILILGLVSVTIMNISYFMSRQSIRTKEQTFGTQKVIQMMEELRSLVSGSEQESINVLDDYDDGAVFNNFLTTDKAVTNPNFPPSNNVETGSGWKYIRQIIVKGIEGEPYARKVNIRVYRADPNNPTEGGELLAETMSVLKTIKSGFVPTQVYDVFILALENVPGWWSALSTMKPQFEQVINDIQNRCSGLEIRTH